MKTIFYKVDSKELECILETCEQASHGMNSLMYLGLSLALLIGFSLMILLRIN